MYLRSLGSHSITARFQETATLGASEFTATVSVAKATPRLTVSSASTFVGRAFTTQAWGSASSDGPSPDARFTLYRDGVEVAHVNGSMSISHENLGLPDGDYTYHATYSGDAYTLPGASRTVVSTVTRYPVDGSITSSVGGSNFSCPPGSGPVSSCAARSPEGQPLTLHVRFNQWTRSEWERAPSGTTTTGLVHFFDGSTEIGTANLVDGLASFTTSTLRVGPHWLMARYDGDANFTPGTTGAMPFFISTGTPPPPARGSGYWMLGGDGAVFAFGSALHRGNADIGRATAEDLERTPSGDGYWIVTDSGRVYTFGDARYHGGINGALKRSEKVTSISSTRSGNGYWLFTSLGRVAAFGDAQHFGDMENVPLNGPVLDSIPTASGNGYYMVASDGGIFTFGDAVFAGSMGDARLNAPVQSLVPDGDGSGYWLVASDGGIFAVDTAFLGSMGSTRLNRPITGMVAFGRSGYLMVGEDGGIFSFGTADFHGSLGDRPPARPISSVASFAP